ncbi:hypothetical protein [Bradyrhizobium sp. NP1]|jgi:hypothetical protein|uniref:hypothetical protein n=1 Tax=Bradyrhizobium sp. NP1 TaxID=3049772 RepID=UPI0025A5A017|nr:hypothetical protein [Bradyrhizobium sp. NP1]WJR81575.1 hypothetical protein QOU61_18065 [Bradyrhizobium sp. NP1]
MKIDKEQLPPPQTQDLRRRCPACAAFPRLALSMLNPTNGTTIRLYECRCGERIWDERLPK